ncbi:MAG: deoxyribose-phosphate aldolase [Clostridiales bacterium]|nr:deoxyribose-phosphate aldolase [Clostridiales bacterium]
MDIKSILATVDHTLLSTTASWDEIKKICDDGIQFQTASVCIPPCYVKAATQYVNGKIPICTVIGFPNGYSTTAVKVYETIDAVNNGADEIDMVIPVGKLKNKEFDELLDEIKAIKKACQGRILKVIVEACLLSQQEKTKICEIISLSGADFIKTSTGFSTGGATREDVAFFAKEVQPHVKVKAAGGISTLADAEDFLSLGASRLGTSRIVKIVKDNPSAYAD